MWWKQNSYLQLACHDLLRPIGVDAPALVEEVENCFWTIQENKALAKHMEVNYVACYKNSHGITAWKSQFGMRICGEAAPMTRNWPNVLTKLFCPLKSGKPELFCGEIPDVAQNGDWDRAGGERAWRSELSKPNEDGDKEASGGDEDGWGHAGGRRDKKRQNGEPGSFILEQCLKTPTHLVLREQPNTRRHSRFFAAFIYFSNLDVIDCGPVGRQASISPYQPEDKYQDISAWNTALHDRKVSWKQGKYDIEPQSVKIYSNDRHDRKIWIIPYKASRGHDIISLLHNLISEYEYEMNERSISCNPYYKRHQRPSADFNWPDRGSVRKYQAQVVIFHTLAAPLHMSRRLRASWTINESRLDEWDEG